MPTLLVEQYQFRDDGIVLNSDAVLPFVDVTKVAGLDSAPTRQTVKDHEGTDGGFIESQYETFRTVVLEGTAYTSPTAFDAYMDALKANFEPNTTDQPFYFQTDAGQRAVYGKSQGLKYEKSNARSRGEQEFNVTILCPDPRVYTAGVISSGPIYLGSGASTGYGFPYGFPYGFGGAVTQSAGSITPGGNRETPGWYVITGPIASPSIINDTLGKQWTFSTSLAAGEQLWIKPRVKTVRLGETGPSRRNTLRGPWWFLKSTQNSFRLLGTGGTAGVTNLEVFAQPAWR
jgi:hypothetical protein